MRTANAGHQRKAIFIAHATIQYKLLLHSLAACSAASYAARPAHAPQDLYQHTSKNTAAHLHPPLRLSHLEKHSASLEPAAAVPRTATAQKGWQRRRGAASSPATCAPHSTQSRQCLHTHTRKCTAPPTERCILFKADSDTIRDTGTLFARRPIGSVADLCDGWRQRGARLHPTRATPQQTPTCAHSTALAGAASRVQRRAWDRSTASIGSHGACGPKMATRHLTAAAARSASSPWSCCCAAGS